MLGKKILAIDDEVDTLAFYSEVLEDHNYIPITAKDGAEGLKKAREEKPDLILLDIMMPHKSGMKVYKELKNDSDLMNIPVIIITGISMAVDFKSLLTRTSTGKISPDSHLGKPITADNLIKKIDEILDQKIVRWHK